MILWRPTEGFLQSTLDPSVLLFPKPRLSVQTKEAGIRGTTVRECFVLVRNNRADSGKRSLTVASLKGKSRTPDPTRRAQGRAVIESL